ncbi:MAG: hypothetical protein GHCLOJNM_03142 [bacterium]|nr:hypothetical protein [bacterium]
MTSERTSRADWARENLEAFLDGDLCGPDRARFEEELDASLPLREELELARGLRENLRALPARTCPERVTRAVLNRVEASGRREVPARERAPLFAWFNLRSTLAGALAVSLLVLVLVSGPRRKEAATLAPTSAAAARQIEATLAYLAQVGALTGAMVGQEVYRAGVVAPIRETTRALSEIKLPSIGRAEKNQEG